MMYPQFKTGSTVGIAGLLASLPLLATAQTGANMTGGQAGIVSPMQGTMAKPPTTLQAPLPAPALRLPRANQPLLVSPGLPVLPDSMKNKPLTINDVVSIAIAASRALALEVEAYQQAQGSLTTVKAGLGPSLSASYTFDRYNQQQSTNIGGQSAVIQQQDISQATAALSLPIDITGELHAAVSQAKFQEIAARLEINRVRNEVVLNTKNAFYNVLRDQALLQVAQDSLQNSVDRLADAQLRFSAGTVTRFDVVQARTDVASAQNTLIKSRNTLSQAFSTLNNTIGINVNTPLQLTTRDAVEALPGAAAAEPLNLASGIRPTLPPENNLNGQPGKTLGDQGAADALQAQEFVVSNPIALGADYESVLKEALGKRAEILREDANIAAARKGITIARSGLLPSLSVGYNLNYAPDGGALSGQALTGYAGLTLTIPLYDSGATRGKVTQARSQLATAETNRREQVDTVTLEVRQAYLNLQQALEAISTARQELAQADESYRLARLRYSAGVTSQVGVSPIIELSNAQQALTQAQSDYVNALYDYNNDRSALDKAVGRYSYTSGPLGFPSPPSSRTVGSK